MILSNHGAIIYITPFGHIFNKLNELFCFVDSSLSSSQSCDRYTEW